MISIGIGALLFAIWYVTLFLEKSIGLSMVLFIAPFSYFFIYILEQNNKVKNKKAKFLLLPILLLSSTYLINNNSFFNACNLLIIPTLLIFMILILIEGKININQKLFEKFWGFIVNPIGNIEESVKKLNEKIKKPGINTKNEEKGKKIKKTAKALLVTFPVLIVVTVLLATADQVFGNIFRNIFEFLGEFFRPLDNIDTSMIFARIVFIVILFFYFIGLFYYYCMKYKVEDEVSLKVEKKNDNFTLKIILVSLNIIYLVFCYIQIKSLFLRNTTLNYADYARQGFFQLMVVSFINLATILIAKKRENKDEYKTNCFINCMSIIMIVFTFIIVISATLRMHFYESEYGYTLLRLLVYCALFTESVLFIPTILFILDKKISLIKSYSIIIITIYICMNFMNFDNIIAKRNIDRYFETGKIDMHYLEYKTGTDAVNQILRIFKEKNASENIKKGVKKYLIEIYKDIDEEKLDFRNFNISRIQAKNKIEKYVPDVQKEIKIQKDRDECMW